ncbi:MAG: UvrD-helicase domain-containing protein, partial [Armatimonadota bacterium]
EVFTCLCDYPDVEVPVTPVECPDFGFARRSVEAFLDRVEEIMPKVAHANGWDDLQSAIIASRDIRRNRDMADDLTFVKILECLDKSKMGLVQARWNAKDEAKEAGELHRALRDEVVEPALRQWREYLYPKLIAFVLPAIAEFQDTRRQKGMLSFEDLLVQVRDILRDNPPIRSYFQARYTHIMVDEFQDTDPVQAEFMMYLTGEDINERDWTKLSPKPGSLFVVGDPKQSIYRFRRADIATYRQVKSIILESGGDVLCLVTNFRSVGSICQWANDVFDNIFPVEASERQAANARLSPVRENELPMCGVFRSVIVPEGRTNESISQPDAARIASFISQAITSGLSIRTEDGVGLRPVTPDDFLIILRNTPRLHIYASALEQCGLPYEVTGAGAFQNSEEVAALLHLLRSVINTDDTLSLVTFLRGPLCGISDQDLYAFHNLDGKFDMMLDPPSGSVAAIQEAWGFLRQARQWMLTIPPSSVIAKICEASGIVAWAKTLDDGDTRAGNLYKAMALAREQEAEGKCLSDIVGELARLMEDRKTEALSVSALSGGAVRIMNLHKAKGLEAPIVFLADPVPSQSKDPRVHIDRSGPSKKAYFTLGPIGSYNKQIVKAQPPGWDELAAREQSYLDAEEQRLLYVAATRAREALIVSVTANKYAWKALGDCILENAPQYTLPNRILSPEAVPDLRSLVETDQSRRQNAEISLKAVSYNEVQASKVAHADRVFEPVSAGESPGKAKGRVLHRLLEMMMNDDISDLQPVIANLLLDEEINEGLASEIEAIAVRVTSTAIWEAAKQSTQKYVEIPFARPQPFDSREPNSTLIGVMDLVFKQDDGWRVVDYKSDHVGNRLEHLRDIYSPQVRLYVDHWKQITGEPTQGSLLFLDTCQCVDVT